MIIKKSNKQNEIWVVKLRSTNSMNITTDMDFRVHKAQPLYSLGEKTESQKKTCPKYQQVKRDGLEHQNF